MIVKDVPKIADVGLVAPLDGDAPGSGTPAYMTPEGKAEPLAGCNTGTEDLKSPLLCTEPDSLRYELPTLKK